MGYNKDECLKCYVQDGWNNIPSDGDCQYNVCSICIERIIKGNINTRALSNLGHRYCGSQCNLCRYERIIKGNITNVVIRI